MITKEEQQEVTKEEAGISTTNKEVPSSKK
jgi:hypothetical protein